MDGTVGGAADGAATLREPAEIAARAPAADRFFLGMAILMLLIVLVGFAPSFFLRSFSDRPGLPPYLHVHGALSTSWFVLFLVQTSLVARRDLRLHRRLGVIGGILAGAIILSGLTVLYFRAMAYHEGRSSLVATTQIVWGNLTFLAAFGAFVGLGVLLRRRPQAHKRLMLLASLSMISQALARFPTYEVLRISEQQVVNDAVYGLGGLAALLALVVLHDVRVRRRPHPAVLWGAPLLLGSIVVTGLALPRFGFTQSLILMLR